MENLLKFNDLLYHQAPGTCSLVEEIDLSSISEFGNILSASFINAICDGARLEVKSQPPEISIDMCLPVIDSVLARFNQPGEQILLTEALIYCNDWEEAQCQLLMFLEPPSLQKLMTAVADNIASAESG